MDKPTRGMGTDGGALSGNRRTENREHQHRVTTLTRTNPRTSKNHTCVTESTYVYASICVCIYVCGLVCKLVCKLVWYVNCVLLFPGDTWFDPRQSMHPPPAYIRHARPDAGMHIYAYVRKPVPASPSWSFAFPTITNFLNLAQPRWLKRHLEHPSSNCPAIGSF